MRPLDNGADTSTAAGDEAPGDSDVPEDEEEELAAELDAEQAAWEAALGANDAVPVSTFDLDASLLSLARAAVGAWLSRMIKPHVLKIPYNQDPDFRLEDGRRWWDVSPTGSASSVAP